MAIKMRVLYESGKKGMAQFATAVKEKYEALTGEKIELHHLGQDKNGPLVELCENSEHGDGNHGTLHTKDGESWRHEPGARAQYDKERTEHWKTRAEGVN